MSTTTIDPGTPAGAVSTAGAPAAALAAGLLTAASLSPMREVFEPGALFGAALPALLAAAGCAALSGRTAPDVSRHGLSAAGQDRVPPNPGRPGRAARRRPGTLAVAVVGWLLLGSVFALLLGSDNPGPAGLLRAGLVDAWQVALTAPLPLAGTAGLVFWLFSLVWWTTYVSARVLATSRPPMLALVAPLLLVVAGIALNAGRPAVDAAGTGLFAIVAAVLLALWRPGRGPAKAHGPSAARRIAGVAVPSLVVAMLGALLGPALLATDDQPRFDPRVFVDPPLTDRRLVSPLALADRWLTEPAWPLFELASDGQPANQRLVVLDDYDGVNWRITGTFAAAGRRLPGVAADGPAGTETRTVRETVTLLGLPTVWLPAPDRPVEVAGQTVRADPDTGILVTATGEPATATPVSGPAAGALASGQGGPGGGTYTVTSRQPVLTEKVVGRAVPDSGARFDTALSLPAGVSDTVRSAAESVTADAANPYQQMVLLADHLRGVARFNPRAAPGSTLAHVDYLLTEGKPATAEQFVTTFVLMARHLGFPARVAVGFTPGTALASGRYQVASTDVAVWAEVAFKGLGWVPFYPVPKATSGPASSAPSLGEPAERHALDQSVAGGERPAAAATPPTAVEPADPSGDTGGPAVWCVLAVLGALVVVGPSAYLAAGALARRRLRRRRSTGQARERIVGAWQETLDALDRFTRLRLPAAAADGRRAAPDCPSESQTSAETVAWAAERLGPASGAAMSELAACLRRALFSPREPDAADADAAWRAAAVVTGEVARLGGRLGRLRRLAEPAWRAGRRGRSRPGSIQPAGARAGQGVDQRGGSRTLATRAASSLSARARRRSTSAATSGGRSRRAAVRRRRRSSSAAAARSTTASWPRR